MSDTMEKLRDRLCGELETIEKNNVMNLSVLDQVDKLTHAIKSIDTIKAMEEANDYSERDYSYARKRDNRGRYSRNYGGYGRRGYSRDDDKEYMMTQLRDIMNDTTDEIVRREVRKLMMELEGN